MAWQKVEPSRIGGSRPAAVKFTSSGVFLNIAARKMLGGPGKAYSIFVELDLRMVGLKLDPAGAFMVTTKGASAPLSSVLETLKVPTGYMALISKSQDPQSQMHFVFGLPPKAKQEKAE